MKRIKINKKRSPAVQAEPGDLVSNRAVNRVGLVGVSSRYNNGAVADLSPCPFQDLEIGVRRQNLLLLNAFQFVYVNCRMESVGDHYFRKFYRFNLFEYGENARRRGCATIRVFFRNPKGGHIRAHRLLTAAEVDGEPIVPEVANGGI